MTKKMPDYEQQTPTPETDKEIQTDWGVGSSDEDRYGRMINFTQPFDDSRG